MKKSPLPERDQGTYQFLKCVFPDEITQDDAYLLIYALDDIGEMSFRAIAHVVAVLMGHSGEDYVMYLNDVYGVQQRQVDPVKAQRVREQLYACGFAEWIEE